MWFEVIMFRRHIGASGNLMTVVYVHCRYTAAFSSTVCQYSKIKFLMITVQIFTECETKN